MLIIHALAASWASLPDLKERSLSWSWFRLAFHQALDARLAVSDLLRRANDETLASAFFNWVKTVEAYACYEPVEPLDFRHFMAGLLLQRLVAAQPHVTAVAGYASSLSLPGPRAVPIDTSALVAFTMTLLQAWRLRLGAPALVIEPALMQGKPWASLLENLNEDSSTAIGFADQLCGLDPAWQCPTLIKSRPAFRKAMNKGTTAQASGPT